MPFGQMAFAPSWDDDMVGVTQNFDRGAFQHFKGDLGRCACTPVTRVKVHLPRVILTLSKRGVLADAPLPCNRGKGTSAACNLNLKKKGKSTWRMYLYPQKGVKAHSPKPPFYKTPLLQHLDHGGGSRTFSDSPGILNRVAAEKVADNKHLKSQHLFYLCLTWRESCLCMGKMGSICRFSCALPASIWGHCSQILVFTSIWGTEKGV